VLPSACRDLRLTQPRTSAAALSQKPRATHERRTRKACQTVARERERRVVSELWTNWSGRVRCTPARWLRPTDEAEIATAVVSAAEAQRGVRVAGSGHSFTPLVATDDVLLSLDAWQGIESIDGATQQATIRAGSRLSSLGE